MKNVPHWQLFIFLYLLMVVVPVYLMHGSLKKRAYANRNFLHLFLYFAGVLGTAYVAHSAVMWLYFTFFFGIKR